MTRASLAVSISLADPPENYHLNVKNCQKLSILKMTIFGNFFLNAKFLAILAFKWQFSGGSAREILTAKDALVKV